jgi:hypothetical protein
MPAQGMELGRSLENTAGAGVFFGRRIPVINRLPLSPEQILSKRRRKNAAGQSVLKGFEGRFVMASNILEPKGANLNRRIAHVARLMTGMLDRATLVELRLILPESDLSRDVAAKGLDRMAKLRRVLSDEHDITRVIPNSHPIMPGKEPGTLSDPRSLWGSVGDELDGFTHQWRMGSERPDLAMFAILPAEYAGLISDGQSGLSSGSLTRGMTVLEHVGARAEQNTLAAAARPSAPAR